MLRVCFTVLLFANLILLAHASIPHHHHENGEICFYSHNKGCEEDDIHSQHNDCKSHNHENEGNPHSEKCCFIDNIYVPADNNSITIYRLHLTGHGHNFYALISNILDINDFVDDKIILFRQNPFLILSYSEFISQSIGLRAPPTL